MAVSESKPSSELTYGVWIRGRGWLKREGQIFADASRELAEGAARLWGHGAEVVPIDDSLIDFESVFVARDRWPWWRRGLEQLGLA